MKGSLVPHTRTPHDTGQGNLEGIKLVPTDKRERILQRENTFYIEMPAPAHQEHMQGATRAHLTFGRSGRRRGRACILLRVLLRHWGMTVCGPCPPSQSLPLFLCAGARRPRTPCMCSFGAGARRRPHSLHVLLWRCCSQTPAPQRIIIAVSSSSPCMCS